MTSPAHGALRLLRATVLAVIALVVAAGAHEAGGGTLPSAPVLAAVAAVVVWGSAVATRWRLSSVAIIVLLGVSQVCLHGAFMVLCPAGSISPASSMAGTAGMAMSHGTMPAAGIGPIPAGSGVGSSPLVMSVCHVVGTAVLAGVCARGEATLWALWSWLAPLVLVLVRSVAVEVEAPRVTSGLVVVRRHLCELFVAVPRRGPPAPVAV